MDMPATFAGNDPDKRLPLTAKVCNSVLRCLRTCWCQCFADGDSSLLPSIHAVAVLAEKLCWASGNVSGKAACLQCGITGVIRFARFLGKVGSVPELGFWVQSFRPLEGIWIREGNVYTLNRTSQGNSTAEKTLLWK